MRQRHTIIPAVHLILEKDGEILLLRRFNTGYEDGRYSMVAGHVDKGETFIEAMIREAEEEAGIIISREDMDVVHVMHRKKDDEERIDFFIRASRWKGNPRIAEKDKCDKMDWFSYDRLPGELIPYVRSAIGMYRNKVLYSEFGWEK